MASKEVISTENAPGAIGPYSQAIKVNGTIFVSGQIPIDPATGEFVSHEVAEQTEQVFKNLIAVLQAAGASLEDVVKTTVFLADMNDFTVMNEIYGRYFDSNKPARATVQAARLPRDAKVEIDCIAVVLVRSDLRKTEHRNARRSATKTAVANSNRLTQL